MAKRKLSQDQEFSIFKLVLDKFLWLGFIIMAYGLYQIAIVPGGVRGGFGSIAVGAAVLLILLIILVNEYEFLKKK